MIKKVVTYYPEYGRVGQKRLVEKEETYFFGILLFVKKYVDVTIYEKSKDNT